MDIEQLIEIVREHPVLYDTCHTDYSRSRMKDELWENIGAELHSDGKTVKEQWRKLRECHREALRRQKKKKIEDASVLQKPWSYQYQMEFLVPHMKSRVTDADLLDSSMCDDGYVDNIAGDGLETLPSPKIEETMSDGVENEVPPKKTKRRSDLPKHTKPSDKFRAAIFEREPQFQHQNDAMCQFFLSMYTTTVGLSPRYQRQIRNKIYEAVSQAEEQHANEISQV